MYIRRQSTEKVYWDGTKRRGTKKDSFDFGFLYSRSRVICDEILPVGFGTDRLGSRAAKRTFLWFPTVDLKRQESTNFFAGQFRFSRTIHQTNDEWQHVIFRNSRSNNPIDCFQSGSARGNCVFYNQNAIRWGYRETGKFHRFAIFLRESRACTKLKCNRMRECNGTKCGTDYPVDLFRW